MLNGILKKIKEEKIEEVKRLKSKKHRFKISNFERKSLSSSIKKQKHCIPIIAEIKRGSPSSGIIREDVSVSKIASDFERAGVCGISVLTDSKFFFSDISFLDHLRHISVPILRKDFILDPIQVEQTASTCASSILLIVRFIESESLLKDLVQFSISLNIEPVVEVFDEKDIDTAKKVEAKVILVNNRDLISFEEDITRSKELIKYKDPEEVWISASGLKDPYELKELKTFGFDGFLIGTSIMKSSDPFRFIRFLKGEQRDDEE